MMDRYDRIVSAITLTGVALVLLSTIDPDQGLRVLAKTGLPVLMIIVALKQAFRR